MHCQTCCQKCKALKKKRHNFTLGKKKGKIGQEKQEKTLHSKKEQKKNQKRKGKKRRYDT